MAGTVSPAAAQSGTTPILVLVNDAASNKFGRYYGEILRAEGLNSYDTATISAMPNLALYKVVLLAETTLNSGQAAALTSYVNGGGYLIAMRPDPQLAGILGLGAAQGTQTNGYLQLAGTGPSQGLATSTLQIHGTVDRYTLASGAVSLAQLFSNATTSTPYPAVVRSANGRGIAFTYDLAYNIVMMRQGNPANANVDTDGDGVLRTIDLFQGSGGGQPWVDLNRTSIPQADEQMRFLARLIQNAINASQPMPQLWYFPGTAKTVLVPTGDAHANPYSYFQDVLSSVTAHGGTMTVYLTEYAGNPSNNDVQGWRAQGHEFGIHPYASPQPADYTKLYTGYASADSFFRNRYASPSSRTVRNHQVTWVGWTDAAEIAAGFGMAMDTNFYHWGPWLQKGDGTWARGYITGSGQPMKFMKADGTVLPYFQQLTQLVDEQYFPIAGGFENLNIPGALAVSQALIDSSLAGDYAALMTQFHIDYDSWGEINGWVTGTLDYANSRGVPVLNADRWLGFTETRYNANYSNIAWNAASSTLTFNLASPATPGVTLSTILPLNYGGNGLQSVTVDGSPAGFTVQTIKGVNVAFVTTAAGNHSLSAVYQGPPFEATPTSTPTSTPTNTPITPPTITPSVTPTLDPSVTASPTPTNTPAPPPVTGCFIDDTVADFSLGTTAGTFVTNDGSVSLSPLLGERFDGSSLPDGWAAAPWVGGGTTTVSGGALTVNGTRAYTTTGYGAGTTLELGHLQHLQHHYQPLRPHQRRYQYPHPRQLARQPAPLPYPAHRRPGYLRH
ncbi:MAG: hypothetical protein HZC41_20250 [Chloroflexi bacterium]|nr:hypothetical protein [Chloroflexota bacterium]